jgi:hypothetical protein
MPPEKTGLEKSGLQVSVYSLMASGRDFVKESDGIPAALLLLTSGVFEMRLGE